MYKKITQKGKRIIFLTMIGVILILLTSPNLVMAGGGGGSEEDELTQPVELDVAANPTTITKNEPVQVSIGLLAHENVCDPVITRRPLDIILLIDGSGSMAESLGDTYTGTKFEGALNAVDVFFGNMDPSLDRVGVIGFNDIATVISEITAVAQAKSALDAYVYQNGQTLTAGFIEAGELFKTAKRADASQAIILLSDGAITNNDITSQADTLKENGIVIYTIGLGPEVNDALLREVATSSSNYYYAPETSELSSIYQSIAESIQTFNTATDVVVTLTFDKTNFDLVDDSIIPTGMRGVDKVTWTIDHITAGKQQMFQIALQPRISGNFTAVRSVDVSYNLCGQSPQKISTGEKFSINVLGNDGSAETCLRSEAKQNPSFINFICGSGIPWMWIGTALVGIALILKWLKDYGNALRAKFRCHVPMNFCPWLKLLFYLSLALLAGALLSSVAKGVCTPQSGLLFWRILPDGRSSYYVKSQIPDVQARPLTDLVEEDERVGFFTSSDENQHILGVFGGISSEILAFDFSGHRVQDIPQLNGSFPAWSPDGTKIAYAYNNEDIYLYDLLTGKNLPLEGAATVAAIETMPAWNSDGSKIAFTRATAGATNQVGTALNIPCDIWVVPSAGGLATMLPGASGVGFNYYPAFSPDGNWLAFVHHIDGTTTDDDSEADVYVVPVEGGLPRAVSKTNDNNGDTLPTWSKDSKKIMFSSKDCGDQYDLFSAEIGPDGTINPVQLMGEVSDDGSFEYLAQEADFSLESLLAILKGLIPYLIPVILLGLLQFLICREKTARDPTDAFVYEYLVDPEIGTLGIGKNHEVTVKLWGKKGYGKLKYIKSVDVILLLDRSGSMMAKDEALLRSRLESAKLASKHFARCVMTPSDRVGIVCFGDEANVIQDLTNDYKEVEKNVDTIDFQGATNMTAGIQAAHQLLKKSGRKGVKQVIILLSDGGTTAQGTLAAAEDTRRDGIRIFTIGTGDADSDMLQKIAGNPGDFQFVSRYSDLEKVFMEAARYLKTKVIGRNVLYTCTYAHDKVDLQIGSIFPRPIKVEQGGITWNFPELLEEKEERFHFKVQSKVDGKFNVITGGTIKYE